MSDITNLFKATVKTVKSRNKAQRLDSPIDKSSILGAVHKKSDFSKKTVELVQNIRKLHEFLLEHRKDYIKGSSLLNQEGLKITDNDRDRIDAEAQTFIKTCSEAIRVYKEQCKSEKLHAQIRDHRDIVFELIEAYLKHVVKFYSEARAVRVKKIVDRKRMTRLEPEQSKRPRRTGLLDPDRNDSNENNEVKLKSKSSLELEVENKEVIQSEELSPEEIQMFESENDQLFQEMNSMVDEVKHIEGKVVEIARLQEIFTEKVLEQADDIDRIADTVVGATENIKDANEEIREAMKNNAGLRVWILFFLIVLSLTLLFLDWYNP